MGCIVINKTSTDYHLRGKDLHGSVACRTYVGTMCSDEDAVGLVQDTGRSVQSVGATAATNMGHMFNMHHDDAGKFRLVYIKLSLSPGAHEPREVGRRSV